PSCARYSSRAARWCCARGMRCCRSQSAAHKRRDPTMARKSTAKGPTEAVLTHPESGSRSESLKPWIWLSAVGGTLVTALSYSALRGTFSEEGWRLALADHALVGDSIAPLAAL